MLREMITEVRQPVQSESGMINRAGAVRHVKPIGQSFTPRA